MLHDAVILSITKCLIDCRPQELTGYVFVNDRQEQSFVQIRNLSPRGDSFFISTYDHNKLMEAAARRSVRTHAFVHSHRSGLEMSEADVDGFRGSGMPWVIVLLRDGKLHWKWYAV